MAPPLWEVPSWQPHGCSSSEAELPVPALQRVPILLRNRHRAVVVVRIRADLGDSVPWVNSTSLWWWVVVSGTVHSSWYWHCYWRDSIPMLERDCCFCEADERDFSTPNRIWSRNGNTATATPKEADRECGVAVTVVIALVWRVRKKEVARTKNRNIDCTTRGAVIAAAAVVRRGWCGTISYHPESSE